MDKGLDILITGFYKSDKRSRIVTKGYIQFLYSLILQPSNYWLGNRLDWSKICNAKLAVSMQLRRLSNIPTNGVAKVMFSVVSVRQSVILSTGGGESSSPGPTPFLPWSYPLYRISSPKTCSDLLNHY